MIELIILAILGIMTYYSYVPFYIMPMYFVIIYWLPKPLIRLMDGSTNVLTSAKNKNIALTFDDVPYDKNTYIKISDELSNFNMKGTFFIISSYVSPDNKNVLVELVRNGHQLGNHGKTNSLHVIKSKNEMIEEIVHCDILIKDIYNLAGVDIPKQMLYRPGCGFFNPTIVDICKDLQYTICLGKVYPNDPIVRSSYINFLYCKYKIEAGDIVILHDRKWTPDMLKNLLPHIKSLSIESVTVQNLTG